MTLSTVTQRRRGAEKFFMNTHTKPALHNAMWPGLVGKGPDSEPPIDLDTMLDLTAAAEVDGVASKASISFCSTRTSTSTPIATR